MLTKLIASVKVKWNLGQVTGQQITILSFLDLLFQIKLPRQNSFLQDCKQKRASTKTVYVLT